MSEAVQDLIQTAPATETSELTESRWSVISFERVEGAGLIYADAAELLDSLDQKGIAGLCITTDEAATRVA